MRKLRIGINGFGRIGRIASRIILSRNDLVFAAINSRAEASSHAYLLKYDSTYGVLPQKIKALNEDKIMINDHTVSVYKKDMPQDIPWKESSVDIVIEATGQFRSEVDMKGHLNAGAKYVVLSAPAKDATKTLVKGVNHISFNPKSDKIISNSSCTTNCLATTLKVLHDKFRVKRAFMTTTHAVTDSQNLLDNSHSREVRLRRASFASIIPASTGSAKDIGKLFPELLGKIVCQAIRVPLLTVSLINLTAEVETSTDKDMVNRSFIEGSHGYLKGILAVSDEELVSKDYTGNTNSSIIDSYLTQVIDGNLVNVYAWYDNEWGYTNRLIDMVEYVAKEGGLL